MRRSLALAALLTVSLIAACGGGDDGAAESSGVLADRILRLGEELATNVQVLDGELPSDLGELLNPGALADTPSDELLTIPVHPQGELLGSFRIQRVDGVKTVFLLYDVPLFDRAVEQSLRDQLNASPWQVTGGQSSESLSVIRFQPTVSGDIEGTAVVRPVPQDDGAALTSIVYIVEIRPPGLVTEPVFELPDTRPLPLSFPAPAVVLDGMTAFQVQWSTFPGGATYQLVLLSPQSPFDVAEAYRVRLPGDGWQLVDDQAVGFATVLDFEQDDGAMLLSLSADAFDEDASLTAVFVTIQVAR